MGTREFLEGRVGRGVAIAFGAGTLILLAYTLMGDDRSSLAGDVNTQTWIDTDGTAFPYKLVVGDREVLGPNGKPAFRAELCFWTKDGKPKADPTPVLLNSNVGKPEPTFCPDCDRLVVPLNMPPIPGVPDDQQQVPPTRGEHRPR